MAKGKTGEREGFDFYVELVNTSILKTNFDFSPD